MKFAFVSQLIIFIILHINGMSSQINKVIQESSSGELASLLNLSDLFSSPLPLYIFQYLLLVSILTALFLTSQAYFSVFLSRKLKNHIDNDKLAILLWGIISNCALLIVNSAWFIHSKHLPLWFYTWPSGHLNTYVCWLILCVPIIYYIWQHISKKIIQIGIVSVLVLVTAFYAGSLTSLQSNQGGGTQKPHVIIIGVDSLRQNLLASHMPYLNEQLKDTVRFEHAFTPLGRTFPAWNSILTGLYPVNHGARINLIDESNLVSTDHYLGNILKKEGYRSIYAMDETHFANMGSHQGFEQVISSRMGASDFLLSSLADYPLTNLLSLAPISSWLLPEVYANRGAATTYRAEAFSELLTREIPEASQPTFLAVHFCLAHWPYRFASKFSPEPDYPEPYYPANLRAVDQQINALMDDLDNKGYLKNSKIVFLSDHGETWMDESRQFKNISHADNQDPIHFKKEAGHGSTLVSDSSRVLISFKGFPQSPLSLNSQKVISLADITPTILDALHINDSYKHDGHSLLDPELEHSRYLPVETGTVINLTADDLIDIEQIIKDMLNRYELKPSGMIRIQQAKTATEIKSKLRGIRTKNHVLSEHEIGSLRLFNLETLEFEHFDDLRSLQARLPAWADAWCDWYQAEDENCEPFK